MPEGEDYVPKYIDSLEDLPISGPDDYDPPRKRKALFHAESEFQLDVNEGDEISSSNLTDAHSVAVLNLATHILTHAAEEPSDVTLGDMTSGGGTITEYSSEYLERYNRLVDKILQTGHGNSKSDNSAVFVNNGKVGKNQTTHTI